jgi:cyclophilin family peptidyl-prolyl cis-trans isomerase
VGTEKRERQKANRQIRLEELQRQQVRHKRKRTATIWGGIGLVAVLIAFFIWLFNRDDGGTTVSSSSTTVAGATTTEPPPNASTTVAGATTVPGATSVPAPFTYGTGECSNPDGSSPKTQTFTAAPKQCIDATKTYTATIDTNKGSFTVVLDPAKAPGTVNNFVTLARYHYFDGTPCHRIIAGFVVQCGDPTGKGTGSPGYTITDELPQAGDYKIGSLAMANSGPNTNGSQFFVITGDQGAQLPPNFSLFGQVTDGLDTTVKALDAAANPDPSANGMPPKEPITINKVTITES